MQPIQNISLESGFSRTFFLMGFELSVQYLILSVLSNSIEGNSVRRVQTPVPPGICTGRL